MQIQNRLVFKSFSLSVPCSLERSVIQLRHNIKKLLGGWYCLVCNRTIFASKYGSLPSGRGIERGSSRVGVRVAISEIVFRSFKGEKCYSQLLLGLPFFYLRVCTSSPWQWILSIAFCWKWAALWPLHRSCFRLKTVNSHLELKTDSKVTIWHKDIDAIKWLYRLIIALRDEFFLV